MSSSHQKNLFPSGRSPSAEHFSDIEKKHIKENISNLNKIIDLRQCVTKNRDVPIPPQSGGPPTNLTNLIVSLIQMISFFMGMVSLSQHQDTQAKGEALIRHFLTMAADFEDNVMNDIGRTTPFWIEKYNYQSLLNIPTNIASLGPVRNRWEGGITGEGYLRYVKPYVNKGRKKWGHNLLKNLLQKKALEMLKCDVQQDDDDETDSDDEDRVSEKVPARSYVKYKTTLEVVSKWNECEPLSVVTLNNDVYVVVESNMEEKFLSVVIRTHQTKYIDGLNYFYLQVENKPLESFGSISQCAILLPSSSSKGMYTIVTTDWKTWSNTAVLVDYFQLI